MELTDNHPQWKPFIGSEPTVRVGLAVANEIDFCPQGRFQRIEQQGAVTFRPLDADARFRVAVKVGDSFHWEQLRQLQYRGSAIITAETDSLNRPTGRQVLINEIGVEEYLKSVISSEMKSTASPAFMRTHAIISRSWLMRMILNSGDATGAPCHSINTTANINGKEIDEHIRWYDSSSHRQFHVCCDDHCQRYHGLDRIRPAAVEAVEATRGIILTYNNEIVDARFSKCCGGYSELYENCWDHTPHPYLTSVTDRLEGDTHDLCDTHDRTLLRQVLNDFDFDTADFYSWHVSYSTSQLSALVARRFPEIGIVEQLVPLHRGSSGRITRLLIIGSKSSIIVGKELEIRYLLSPTCLYSSAFVIEKSTPPVNYQSPQSAIDHKSAENPIDSKPAENSVGCKSAENVIDHNPTSGEAIFTIRGRGWGHGVGLCQIGAAVMGARGFDHPAILAHYFPHATLTSLY